MDYVWPGWPLDRWLRGDVFDIGARTRMVQGSRVLLPFIESHVARLGQRILEVGPFFHPLVTLERFPGRQIVYWENDRHVLRWLRQTMKPSQAVHCNLRKLRSHSLSKRGQGRSRLLFDTVIASQVFNYLDPARFVRVLHGVLKEGGLLFVNNVVGYGLPSFFSPRRPRSAVETVRTLKDAGYEILEKHILDSPYPRYQRNKRLVCIARRLEAPSR
jgi:hypothetical protein